MSGDTKVSNDIDDLVANRSGAFSDRPSETPEREMPRHPKLMPLRLARTTTTRAATTLTKTNSTTTTRSMTFLR